MLWFVRLLRLGRQKLLGVLDQRNPKSLVMKFLVRAFWVNLCPAFAIEAAGNLAKKALVGIKPIDLIEFCFLILNWTTIKVFSVLDKTPRPDLKSPRFRSSLVKNDLIVNEPALLIEKMIELDQVDVFVDGLIAFM